MLTRLAGLLVFLVSCAVAKAATPTGPGGLRVAETLAPGDTLAYTVSWTAGSRAVSYDFTVSVAATNGTWSAIFGSTAAGPLPATGNTTALTFAPKLVAIPWDSATFTVTVVARNPAGVSSPATASWTVRRKPGPPGPPKVDSSATVTGLLTKPDSISFTAAGQTRQICPVVRFRNGAVALAVGAIYHPLCDSLLVRLFTPAQRTVTVAQQVCADSGGPYCVFTTGLRSPWQWERPVVRLAAQ